MESIIDRRTKLLGMHPATASGKLLRDLLFSFIEEKEITCHRCGGKLLRDNFSIEHKEAWMSADDPLTSFFDLTNVTYSHRFCNYSAAVRQKSGCGSIGEYNRGCRCEACKTAARTKWNKRKYNPEKRRRQYLRTGS